MAKRLVGKVELDPDEILVVVESGSFVHAGGVQTGQALQGIESSCLRRKKTSRLPRLLAAESRRSEAVWQ